MAALHGLTEPVFIKQYGYYRTGTNFVEAALPRNYYCTILRNVMGIKHYPPKPWKKVVRKASKGDLPAGLLEAVLADEVGAVVNLKDPYGWLCSFITFWKWKRQSGLARKPANLTFVRSRTKLYSKL